MLYVVIAYLWTSLLLYILLGGADFGAGIVELFTSRRNRKKTRMVAYEAIGPIWEANHMWLIIAIVILFVGFPVIYATISTYLHIPLVLMLMGIIARGTALTFRNYDAVVDDMQKIYSRIFIYSSFITPFFLGIIAASTVSAKITTTAQSFADAYIFSWLNLFSLSTGIFTVTICGYLAAVYLTGEVKEHEDEHKRYIIKAKNFAFAAFGCGTWVFAAAWLDNIPLFEWVFGSMYGIIAVVAASLSFLVFQLKAQSINPLWLRTIAASQVIVILFVATYAHFPDIVLTHSGQHLSLLEHHEQIKAIDNLGWALLLGSTFILPALFYLIYSFRKKKGYHH